MSDKDREAAEKANPYKDQPGVHFERTVFNRGFRYGIEYARAESQASTNQVSKSTNVSSCNEIKQQAAAPQASREEMAREYAEAELGYGPDLEKAYLTGFDAATAQMQAEVEKIKRSVDRNGNRAVEYFERAEKADAELAREKEKTKALVGALRKLIPLASNYRRLKLGFDTEEIKVAGKLLAKHREES